MTSGTPFGGDPDDTIRSLDEIARKARETHKRFAAMREQVQEVAVTEQSADGAVKVTVQSSGALKDLVFSDKVRQINPSRLASVVLHCVQRAQARLADRVQDLVDGAAPDDETGRRIVASFRDRFPQPPTEYGEGPASHDVPQMQSHPSSNEGPPTAAGRPVTPVRRESEEYADDWDNQSLLIDPTERGR